jgi:alpha-galactosidase
MIMRWSTVQLRITDSAPVHVLGMRPTPGGEHPTGVPLVEVDIVAAGRSGNSTGSQHTEYATGRALRYVDHAEEADTLVIRQRSSTIEVTTRLQQVGPAVRILNEITNIGTDPVVLAYASTLSLTGFGPVDAIRLHEARNAWCAELRWQDMTMEQAGVVYNGWEHGTSRSRHAVTALGSWSTSDYLPIGGIENIADGLAWVWQVEHNGGWHWEVGDLRRDVYLLASGPTDQEHHWRQPLAPGEPFTTVPVAVAVTEGGLTDGLRALNAYRRAIRRPSADCERLPVIFNDFMNCLNGDPSEEKLAPLIEAAAEVGSEYFVIDAGWYADDGGWWETVGEWEPSSARFPRGLGTTMQRIRDAGMVPGLWLEPEVVGVRSPVAQELPDDAFFTEGALRRQEIGRFHLDFQSTEVRRRMDAVVDRLVRDYGVGYFKLDYNVDLGNTFGARMLGHNRAFLAWLDGILDRHPDVVLENCASGGMRLDYAMLSRLSVHSTSDQPDQLLYAPIAAAAPSAVTPEQSAVWAYPQPEHSPEQASFCMVNALLGRVHQSGRIDLMSGEQRARVRDAIDVYKLHRALLAKGDPYWPLGLPGWHDPWLALAIRDRDEALLAVWYRGGGPHSVTLPLAVRAAELLFPRDLPLDLALSGTTLRLGLPGGPAARLLRVSF